MLVLALLASFDALAAEMTRFSVGVAPVYAKNVTAPPSYGADGIGASVRFAYNLTPDWALRSDLLFVHHIGAANVVQTLDLSLNVLYTIDIGTFVPYLILGFSWSVVIPRGDAPIYDGALHFGLGLAWRINRRWSVALEGKNMVFFRDFTSYPSYLVLGLVGRVHW
ncbi:MAG: outer membrane beta-barrel protein [Myxococcales bacterium]|nr:outer membrane beta-barrel protein [Myxococcales bacterium]